jgi:CubicO group peptidase (beta-lactamase class C family)
MPRDKEPTMKTFAQTGRRAVLGLALAAVAAPCVAWAANAPSADQRASANSAEPGLPAALPDSVGVDSTPLIRMSEWIRHDKLDVRSFLVVKDGKLIFERYSDGLDRDYNYELYSVTKTVTALVFGILAGEGKIKPGDEAASWIIKTHPEFADALRDKQDIKLRDLMSMASGLHYKQVEGTDPLYYAAPNRLQVALTTTRGVPPATEFDYTDVNPVLVGAAISAAANEPEDRFAEERLFKPLGMKNYHWTGADKTGSVSGGWGLRLRAVDMAKLGVMMLQGGRWQDQEVVPRSWIEQMSKPSATAKDYGYYCWINHVVETEPEFGAMGFKGQFITVLPKENAVVVMTSILPTDGGLRDATYLNLYRRMVNEYVLPAIHGKATAPAGSQESALRRELELSAQSHGVPGTALAFNDAPER